MATKREIERRIKKLLVDVGEYNTKCKPNSDEDNWSGDIYEALCNLPPAPKKSS
jgi:hypothetical protein